MFFNFDFKPRKHGNKKVIPMWCHFHVSAYPSNVFTPNCGQHSIFPIFLSIHCVSNISIPFTPKYISILIALSVCSLLFQFSIIVFLFHLYNCTFLYLSFTSLYFLWIYLFFLSIIYIMLSLYKLFFYSSHMFLYVPLCSSVLYPSISSSFDVPTQTITKQLTIITLIALLYYLINV